jgi:hypothetical protein
MTSTRCEDDQCDGDATTKAIKISNIYVAINQKSLFTVTVPDRPILNFITHNFVTFMKGTVLEAIQHEVISNLKGKQFALG